MAHSLLSQPTGSVGSRGTARSKAVLGVRVLEARENGATVVEIRRPRSHNSLSWVYGALMAVGVGLVHTEVRVSRHWVVQKLHVVELDDSRLTSDRLGTVLQVLRAV